nr:enolase C-terminal domain-like protein [Agrobacterium pusense]
MSEAELADYAEASLGAGFRAMKLRLGAETVKEDFARIEALASAVAGRAFLMADANQFYGEQAAIEVGQGLQRAGFGWYEEPSSQLDLKAAERIREAVDVPIASGENCYSRFDAIDLIASNSLQVFMPDLQRIGGVTEFARSMVLAQDGGLDISTHLFPEYSLQLLATAEKQGYLEYVPWFSGLYNETVEMRDGLALVPDRPGWGFTLNWNAIEPFEVSRG